MSEITTIDSSLALGNTAQDRLEKQHAAMADILPMFELDDETFEQVVKDFVDARAVELSVDAETQSVGASNGGTEKFIGPETPMVLAALLSRDYFLDDNYAYTTSFRFVRDFYKRLIAQHPEDKDRAYLNAVLQGANIGQAAYFDSWTSVDESARLNLTADIVSEETHDVSISDFGRMAACQERAGVAHNALLIFGLTSRLEAGEISVKNEDGSTDSEAHAFISVRSTDGTKVIFDPTNPKFVRNKEGKIVNATAAVYKMGDPLQREFTGELAEFTLADGLQQESRRREVTYTFKN